MSPTHGRAAPPCTTWLINRLLAAVSRVIPTGCHATRQPSRVGLHRERFAAGMQQFFSPQQMASLSVYDQ